MSLSFTRGALLALAAAMPFSLPVPTAFAQGTRVQLAEASPDLKKRADALFKGVGEYGGTLTFGAV